MDWLGSAHVGTPTHRHATIDDLCFLWVVRAGEYKSDRSSAGVRSSRVEAGSNTSTVTLRVVGGDEKGSLESETVN
jgi:hypothetical protein